MDNEMNSASIEKEEIESSMIFNLYSEISLK